MFTRSRVQRAMLGAAAAGALPGLAAAQCPQWADGPFTNWSFNEVDALAQMGGRLVVGGDFQAATAAGGQALRVAAWDGVDVTAFGAGMNGTVRALKAYSPFSFVTNLVAGGDFTTADGVTVNRVAIWSENAIVAFPPPAWAALGQGFNGTVSAIEVFNNQIYAAGSFTASGATAMNRVARYNGTTHAWEALGTGLNGAGLSLQVWNGALYVGGAFTTAGGLPTGAVARWNGSAWSALSSPFGGTVSALESVTPLGGAGWLMLGGSWGGASPNLVAWDGVGFADIVASGGSNGPVHSYFFDSGIDRLYAGGQFNIITGRGCGNTAILNPFQGGGWDPLQGGTDGDVRALQGFHGELVAGGTFSTAGGVSRPRIARWFRTGTPWIARQPISVTGCIDSGVFTCREANGYQNGRTYQWFKDGVQLADGPTGTGSRISGATAGTLLVHNASNADEGNYTCRVSIQSCGSVVSSPATFRVCLADDDCNGRIEPADVSSFVNIWLQSLQFNLQTGDFDHNGVVEPADVSLFVATWFGELTNGC